MQVTHFSFWNCDAPINAIYLSLHVQDQQGVSLTNTYIQLRIIGNTTIWWLCSNGITDDQGNVSGLVPSSVLMELNILPDAALCPVTSLNTQNIGSFTSNSTLTVTGTLALTQGLDSMHFSGIANDCSGQPLQHGTALINSGQYYKYEA